MKIFNIGWHKTGTTSIGTAFEILGFSRGSERYHQVSNNFTPLWCEGKYHAIFEYAKKYESFDDSPWCHPGFYKELDKRFPNSKFILTVRNPDSWVESLGREWERQLKKPKNSVAFRMLCRTVFGSEIFNPKHISKYISVYEKHNSDAKQYFKNRPSDFLVMNLEEDGWEKLCPFLDQPVPDMDFPHRNKHDTSRHGEYPILKELFREHAPKHKIVVDVGAKTAKFSNSYNLLVDGWKGLLIEPTKESYATLVEECKSLNAEILQMAIADYEGTGTLHVYACKGHNSLLDDRKPRSIREFREVKVRKLANVLRGRKIPKDFDVLTIDTEGMDYRILDSLMTSRFRPRIIIYETSNKPWVHKGYKQIAKTSSNAILERV